MPRVPLSIATGFYESRVLPLSAQRCVNWIPVVSQDEALDSRALFGAPGINTFSATVSTNANRGSILVDGVPYFVSGSTLYSYNSTGLRTSHGTVGGAGRVSLATNGIYIVIVVPGGTSYTFNKDTATFSPITDPDFRPSDTVVFKDGYFVFTASDGTVFFNSALNDPTQYDPLDFGSSEISPDPIIAAHTNHNELFILDEETITLFQNIGGAGFPFQRIAGANIEKGCHARFTPINFDNTFVFVGGGKNERSAVWKVVSSSNAIKISTDAIDKEIQKFTRDEISNSFSWTYSDDTGTFVGFTFENATSSRTFVYDAVSSALTGRPIWHERQTGVNTARWRVNSIVQAYGKLLVGDNVDDRVGEIDLDTYTEYGSTIFRQKAGAPFSNLGNPMYEGEIELTLESGVGLTSGQGSDPEIRMDFSDNGGRTFSNEFRRKIGKIGEYGHRTVWRRLGRIPAHRVHRFTLTDPVKANVIKLEANLNG